MGASLAALLGVVLLTPARAATPDRAYWLDLKAHDFKLPAGTAVASLARQVLVLLSSTDPELRDGVGYEAFAAWVYRDELLTAPDLEALRTTLVAAARSGLGEAAGDGIFRRSFALLDLSVMAAEDLKRPFLSEAQFHELLDVACDALTRERDLRGYVPGKGWAHATAHGADLLKFLGRSPHLTPRDAARIVAQVAERLRSAAQVFVWGEDARLAAALAALPARADYQADWFAAWFARLRAEHAALWTGPLDVGKYIAVRAQLNALGQLAARLNASEPGSAYAQLRATLGELLQQAG